MAFLIKNSQATRQGLPRVEQHAHVSRAAGTLPQTTTQNIFQVRNGRVLVKLLMGEVTTIIQSSDPVLKVTSTAKNAAGTTVGTAVDIASTVDTSSLEVGGKLIVEGDGTALVKSNAGAAFGGAIGYKWVAPQGYINIETGASKTGAIKWDLFYEPLDEGADVVAVALNSGV